VSIDRRLREGFQRSAPAIAPKDRTPLERVTVRARHHVMVRRAATTLFVAILVWGVTLGGPRVMDALRDGRHLEPAQQPTPSAPVPVDAAITGTYTTTLGSEDPAVRRNRMVGEWTITFSSDGVLQVSSPGSFQESRSGYSFEVSGDQFRTDLFRTDVCNDKLPGRYRWQMSGDHLTFEVLDEPCSARAALFSSGPYVSQQEP
jgi:hypothetical protein